MHGRRRQRAALLTSANFWAFWTGEIGGAGFLFDTDEVWGADPTCIVNKAVLKLGDVFGRFSGNVVRNSLLSTFREQALGREITPGKWVFTFRQNSILRFPTTSLDGSVMRSSKRAWPGCGDWRSSWGLRLNFKSPQAIEAYEIFAYACTEMRDAAAGRRYFLRPCQYWWREERWLAASSTPQ